MLVIIIYILLFIIGVAFCIANKSNRKKAHKLMMYNLSRESYIAGILIFIVVAATIAAIILDVNMSFYGMSRIPDDVVNSIIHNIITIDVPMIVISTFVIISLILFIDSIFALKYYKSYEYKKRVEKAAEEEQKRIRQAGMTAKEKALDDLVHSSVALSAIGRKTNDIFD